MWFKRKVNMFTAGGSYARLSCRQGADLRTDMVCKLVLFFMSWKHSYGFLQSTYSKNYLVETIPINEYNIYVWE